MKVKNKKQTKNLPESNMNVKLSKYSMFLEVKMPNASGE